MENGAFALKEQMLHFPLYFQIHIISKASKGVIKELSGAFHLRTSISFTHLDSFISAPFCILFAHFLKG